MHLDTATYRVDIANRLLIAMQANDLTPADVAKQFGIKRARIGHWLTGRYYPEPIFLLQFCTRYRVSFDWILAGRVSDAVSRPLGAVLRAEARASERAGQERDRKFHGTDSHAA